MQVPGIFGVLTLVSREDLSGPSELAARCCHRLPPRDQRGDCLVDTTFDGVLVRNLCQRPRLKRTDIANYRNATSLDSQR